MFTTSPKRADPVPGPRPVPELARYDQIHPERTGVRAPAPQPAPAGEALGVLAGVLDRKGQQASATPDPPASPRRRRPDPRRREPQHWVIASFEHHTSPHGLPRPHVHNIVITRLTTGT